MGSTMTDNTEHKPGCEALGGYGHGIGPCSCSEAQPEALRLADEQEAAVATLQNLGYTYQGGMLWKPPLGKAPDFNMLDSLRGRAASLEDQLIAQANRAVIAEQQVTALTQRLDMANRLNTDARDQLAQVSARQAALDGWRIALERIADPRNKHFAGDAQIVALDALSAAPPPPEREPLTDEQIDDIFRAMYGCEPDASGEFSDVCRRVESAHGIGATNDNP